MTNELTRIGQYLGFPNFMLLCGRQFPLCGRSRALVLTLGGAYRHYGHVLERTVRKCFPLTPTVLFVFVSNGGISEFGKRYTGRGILEEVYWRWKNLYIYIRLLRKLIPDKTLESYNEKQK